MHCFPCGVTISAVSVATATDSIVTTERAVVVAGTMSGSVSTAAASFTSVTGWFVRHRKLPIADGAKMRCLFMAAS
jgi:hypothetical protein